jgi:hypothetical protein
LVTPWLSRVKDDADVQHLIVELADGAGLDGRQGARPLTPPGNNRLALKADNGGRFGELAPFAAHEVQDPGLRSAGQRRGRLWRGPDMLVPGRSC